MQKDFKIWCNTDEELEDVLTQAGRDGFTWISGHNPIDYKTIELDTPAGIVFYEGHIYYAGTREDFNDPRAPHMVEISAQDYIQNGTTNVTTAPKTVEITRGRLLEVFETITQSDDSTKKMIAEAPLMLAVIGVMIVKIEDELFKDEPVDKTLS